MGIFREYVLKIIALIRSICPTKYRLVVKQTSRWIKGSLLLRERVGKGVEGGKGRRGEETRRVKDGGWPLL